MPQFRLNGHWSVLLAQIVASLLVVVLSLSLVGPVLVLLKLTLLLGSGLSSLNNQSTGNGPFLGERKRVPLAESSGTTGEGAGRCGSAVSVRRDSRIQCRVGGKQEEAI